MEQALLAQLAIGALMLTGGVLLHAVVLDVLASWVRRAVDIAAAPLRAPVRLRLVVFAALGTFSSHIVQVWVWAFLFLLLGEFDALEPALYFSTVSFTTLGFGDLVISPDWRLLGAFEAAAGLLLFGLTTAFLFEVLREIWRRGSGGGASGRG